MFQFVIWLLVSSLFVLKVIIIWGYERGKINCTKIKIKLNDATRRCIEWIWFFWKCFITIFFISSFFSFLSSVNWIIVVENLKLNLKLSFSPLFWKKLFLFPIIDDNISHCHYHSVYYTVEIIVEVDIFIFFSCIQYNFIFFYWYQK